MRVLITGGCGFLGTNLAASLLEEGAHVALFDNLSRPGSEENLAWLRTHPNRERQRWIEADIREAAAVEHAVADADVVVHLAGQVAVTTSVEQPRYDFDVNALGTLNVLEAARAARRPPIVLFASTNKVYGAMEDVGVVASGDRYDYVGLDGVDEAHPLDLHSPYGCSKGCADQYVLDYARIYGLRTIVFRMSCIYGPHQFGNEDQGWVAHFVRSALAAEPLTIYGDGMQVRDVLFVEDALRAYRAAVERIDAVSGQAFNLGGGRASTLSLLELLEILEARLGVTVARSFADWRPGDQRVYISDVKKAGRLLDWEPTITPEEGLDSLIDWLTGVRSPVGVEDR